MEMILIYRGLLKAVETVTYFLLMWIIKCVYQDNGVGVGGITKWQARTIPYRDSVRESPAVSRPQVGVMDE